MRRRLDIAASIVVTPELMFLDEPTTGLDPRSRNQVWDIVRALVAEGTTILLCTQYLDEADQLADGIAVIDHGKVIAEGTPAQLKASVGYGALHRAPRSTPTSAPRQSDCSRSGSTACIATATRRRCRPPAATPPTPPRPSRALTARRRRRRRLLARPAEPGRGLPRADRPPGRRAVRPTTPEEAEAR